MSEITAGDEFRDPPPPASSRGAIEVDVPVLLPLVDEIDGIHIYTRSHPQFATLNKVRFERTDITPLAIVRPTTEAEIAAVVRTCADAEIPIAIRSGGNDISERSRVDGGVVIDVRSLDSMTIAADKTSVRIGGGITAGQISRFLGGHGFDTPLGWDYAVGYVAWACGGGYGLECGSRGLGVDQILGGRVVTTSGEVVGINDSPESADALWALRGGGAGVIGVVSELTIKVYPMTKTIAGFIWFPHAEAEKVFANMQRLYQDSFPDKFAGEVFLIDPMGNGGAINHMFWWELKEDRSDLEQAKAYYKRITELGTVILDTVKDAEGHFNEMTQYDFLGLIKNPGILTRQMCYNTSLIVPSFSAELGAIFARHPLPTTISAVVLHNCHGVAARKTPGSAFGNRDPHLLVGVAAQCSWEDQETKQRIQSWPTVLYDELLKAGLNTEWKYTNFNPREKGDGKMYLGEEGAKRMREIKKRLDPKGLFANSSPDLEV